MKLELAYEVYLNESYWFFVECAIKVTMGSLPKNQGEVCTIAYLYTENYLNCKTIRKEKNLLRVASIQHFCENDERARYF